MWLLEDGGEGVGYPREWNAKSGSQWPLPELMMNSFAVCSLEMMSAAHIFAPVAVCFDFATEFVY